MNRKKKWKIIGYMLVFLLIASNVALILPAPKAEPVNPIEDLTENLKAEAFPGEKGKSVKEQGADGQENGRSGEDRDEPNTSSGSEEPETEREEERASEEMSDEPETELEEKPVEEQETERNLDAGNRETTPEDDGEREPDISGETTPEELGDSGDKNTDGGEGDNPNGDSTEQPPNEGDGEHKQPDDDKKPNEGGGTNPSDEEDMPPADKGDNEDPDNGEHGEKPGTEEGIQTNLKSGIIQQSELENNILKFYVRYSNPMVDAEIRVNYRHESDKSNGKNLLADGINYQTTLDFGTNIILIYYTDSQKNKQMLQFKIDYEADKADRDTPEIGEHPPKIETNLDNWEGVIYQSPFTLQVRARTWEGKNLSFEHIQVTMNGAVQTDVTGKGLYEYKLNFERPTVGDVNIYDIEILAWDGKGNSVCRTFTVEYHARDEGEMIGYVTVIIDTTTVGMGFIGDENGIKTEIIKGQPVSAIVLNVLEEEYGFEVEYGGTIKKDFYLRRISQGDAFDGASIPEKNNNFPVSLREMLERDGVVFSNHFSRDSLGEQDFTMGSGWMYSVNGIYPGEGMSNWFPNNGDVIHLRFTLAWGKDIGAFAEQENGYGILSSYCGMWVDEGYIPLEHDFQEKERKEPTETEDGYILSICSRCREENREILPATGGGAEPGPGGEPNPGGEVNPGGEPNPGGETDPGGEPNPGGEVNPGEEPNPGEETDPGGELNPGGETDSGGEPVPGGESAPEGDSDLKSG